jgi:hypothetical protein
MTVAVQLSKFELQQELEKVRAREKILAAIGIGMTILAMFIGSLYVRANVEKTGAIQERDSLRKDKAELNAKLKTADGLLDGVVAAGNADNEEWRAAAVVAINDLKRRVAYYKLELEVKETPEFLGMALQPSCTPNPKSQKCVQYLTTGKAEPIFIGPRAN